MRVLLNFLFTIQLISALPPYGKNVDLKKGLSSKFHERIIGGTVAHYTEAPFAAAIFLYYEDDINLCAGALIREQWILTAAQCLYGVPDFIVQLGSCSLRSGDYGRVTLFPTNFAIHADYDDQTLDNDIALLQLDAPVELDDYLNTINLPVSAVSENAAVTAFGWGVTDLSHPIFANNLVYVHLNTMSNSDCRRIFGDAIKDDMLCAYAENKGTCFGDSGGPLISASDQSTSIVGISIFYSGNGCEANNPSGFLRIFPYINWITETIEFL